MATTVRTIAAPPDAVWEILADPRRYSGWVVGAHDVRGVEGAWPDPGATFHHTVGVWPLRLRDNTSVLESEPGRRLVLEGRIRPIGVLRIEVQLRPVEGGTAVTMVEVPTAPLPARLIRPLLDPLTDWRNRASLRRLDRMVTGTAR